MINDKAMPLMIQTKKKKRSCVCSITLLAPKCLNTQSPLQLFYSFRWTNLFVHVSKKCPYFMKDFSLVNQQNQIPANQWLRCCKLAITSEEETPPNQKLFIIYCCFWFCGPFSFGGLIYTFLVLWFLSMRNHPLSEPTFETRDCKHYMVIHSQVSHQPQKLHALEPTVWMSNECLF